MVLIRPLQEKYFLLRGIRRFSSFTQKIVSKHLDSTFLGPSSMNLVEMYLDVDINKFTEEDKVGLFVSYHQTID